jgi:hypothetical protein
MSLAIPASPLSRFSDSHPVGLVFTHPVKTKPKPKTPFSVLSVVP